MNSKVTPPILIEKIEARAAKWIAQGMDDHAAGLISFFKNYVNIEKIEYEANNYRRILNEMYQETGCECEFIESAGTQMISGQSDCPVHGGGTNG